MICVSHHFICLLFSLCPGQHSADDSPGLPHPVSHPVSLRQRQHRLSRHGTITPHFPVSSARRTSSRYTWTWGLQSLYSLDQHYEPGCCRFLLLVHRQISMNLCSSSCVPKPLIRLLNMIRFLLALIQEPQQVHTATRSKLLHPHVALPHPVRWPVFTHTIPFLINWLTVYSAWLHIQIQSSISLQSMHDHHDTDLYWVISKTPTLKNTVVKS